MDTKESSDDNAQTPAIKVDSEIGVSECLDPTGVLVKPKWRGTSEDKVDMATLGRSQVLRVSAPQYCNRSPLPHTPMDDGV